MARIKTKHIGFRLPLETLEKLELDYDICREPHRLRSYDGFTHVLVRRKAFGNLREKLEKLELMAFRRKVTLTEVIREALVQYVDRQHMAG